MCDIHTRYNIRPYSPTLEYRAKTRLIHLRKLILYMNAEKGQSLPIPFSKRLRAWYLGFTSLSYLLYELDRNDPKQYLPDFADIDYGMHTPSAVSINDKLNFFRNLRSLNLSCPKVLALIDRGSILFQDQGSPQSDLDAWLRSLLEIHGKIVFKPVFGGAGTGIFFLQKKGNGYEINGNSASLSEICRLLKKIRYCLATAFIEQASYAERIYPRVTNTVRMLTVWDAEKKMPFIAASAHRIGSIRSFPLDNFHGGRGGLSAAIDLDSGLLGPGMVLTESGRVCRHDNHPETGEQIKGLTVPHWDEIKQNVMTAAVHFANSPYVGWDLVVTDKGCTFLEGNSPPGTAVWQVHTPLLLDARIRSFYDHQGML